MLPIIIRVVVFGLIGYLIFRVARPSYPVSLVLTSDGVMKSKGIDKNVRRVIDDFAREQLLDGETVLLKGSFTENGRIRWVFPKNFNASLAQRFRNLMIAERR